MYLSELNIWNFRKYGEIKEEEEIYPGLSLELNSGFNLLVGENDSGKSAIIDAIKYTILTQSYDYIRLEEEDFHLSEEEERASDMKIECMFRGFHNTEAKNFLEWIGMEEIDGESQYFLKVFLVAKRRGGKVSFDVKAGPGDEGTMLNGEARNLLRSTYLTPLRDAERELAPRKNSRLSQILNSHESFKNNEEDHYLFTIMRQANINIEKYFEGLDQEDEALLDENGAKLLDEINKYLYEFSGTSRLESNFGISEMNLKNILEKLSLNLLSAKSGLGSHNLLFIAVELLLLKREGYSGLKLALIEEIEAHIHTQAQIRLINFLQEEAERSKIQLILTTHSPILASKIDLKNLIICKNNKVFPMGAEYTELEKGDYLFLERFLDSTKANLFFAEGVLLVEGDAENLLIPTIAEIIDKPLSRYGVSLVNVGNTAFLRYSKIFKRANEKEGILEIPVSCITDNDIKPNIYKSVKKEVSTKSDLGEDEVSKRRTERKDRIEGQKVKLFISPEWTLEYDMALGCLQREIYKAVLQANKIQNSDKYVLTDEKRKDVEDEIKEQYKVWEAEETSEEEKAFYIYYHIMLEKQISKSITAQCLAVILKEQEKAKIKERILTDQNLCYLVKAISYVTDGEDMYD